MKKILMLKVVSFSNLIKAMHTVKILALSTEEVDDWKKKYDQESFPGLEIPMEDVTAMMTAPDPGAAVGAKAISNAG